LDDAKREGETSDLAWYSDPSINEVMVLLLYQVLVQLSIDSDYAVQDLLDHGFLILFERLLDRL
jgi:hypothetical protein